MFTIANGIILKGQDLTLTKENIVVDDGIIIDIGKESVEGKIIDVDDAVVCPSFATRDAIKKERRLCRAAHNRRYADLRIMCSRQAAQSWNSLFLWGWSELRVVATAHNNDAFLLPVAASDAMRSSVRVRSM